MDETVHQARAIALSLLLLLPVGSRAAPSQAVPRPPSVQFAGLYRAVEMSGMFPDQKSFADAIPDAPPETIMAEYDGAKTRPGFDLKAFVAAHFKQAPRAVPPLRRQAGQSVSRYIAQMWNVLERKPDPPQDYSSLLPLGHPYVVPGGRFSEIYYWDSYFTMLGLIQDGRGDLARDMLANIAGLIRAYGHMPNGNRSYYLSRSQPPFFSAMVELIAAQDGEQVYRTYLPELRAEYDYWMAGADRLRPGIASRHVVQLKDGTLLNRYWDDRAAPRDESYAQDVETARQAGCPADEMYRQLRATSESGWDFSSRWLSDGIHLSTVHTTDFAPVDLNVLMQHLETVLARAYRSNGDARDARLFAAKADARKDAIRRLMWNEQAAMFTDYLWRTEQQSPALTLAGMFPLYFHLATQEQSRKTALTLRDRFLMPGGLVPTLRNTGQQWDRPNGWAPLEYLAIEGLKAYGETALAGEIAKRWMEENIGSFAASGLLMEKYNVAQLPKPHQASPGGGGEYALQVGFGWTNGVLAKLMAEYPKHARAAEAEYPVP
jgi:alpha,alpha-trehalase